MMLWAIQFILIKKIYIRDLKECEHMCDTILVKKGENLMKQNISMTVTLNMTYF